MNKHLEEVFNILLPEFEKYGIDYWVYGGVSIAAYAGRFIRRNKDVDVFVRNIDFEKAKITLKKIMQSKYIRFNIQTAAKSKK